MFELDSTLQELRDQHRIRYGNDIWDVHITRRAWDQLQKGVDLQEITDTWARSWSGSSHGAYRELLLWPSLLESNFGDDSHSLVVESLHALQRRKEAELRAQAESDPHTGLLNKAAWVTRVRSEIARARRYSQPLTILLLDLDGFKSVNDHAGHAFGDRVLTRVAELLLTHTREHDLIGRVGGDEFAVCLVGGSEEAAEELLRRLSIHLSPIQRQLGAGNHFGISGGIARYPNDGEDISELLDQCDKALYTSKGAPLSRQDLVDPASVSILVCEDDNDLRDLCRDILENDGYQIIETATIASAQKYLEDIATGLEKNIDLILLDLELSDGSGWEIAENIVQILGDEDIPPILIMTGMDEDENLDRAVQAGVSGYLTKPFSPSELSATVTKTLDNQSA